MGRGGYEPFTEKRTLKSANVVCVYLFVNTYTQNTPVQKKNKKTLCGTPSLAKKKTTQKKYQLLSLAYSFEFMVVVIL